MLLRGAGAVGLVYSLRCSKGGDLGHPYNTKRRIIETLCQIIVSNGRDLLSLLFFGSFVPALGCPFGRWEIIDRHKQYCVRDRESFTKDKNRFLAYLMELTDKKGSFRIYVYI